MSLFDNIRTYNTRETKMITNPITAVEMVIEGVKKSSRLFNEEPPTVKPPISLDEIARELGDAIEVVNTLTYELRRVENRLVILQSKLAGTEVGK